MGDLNEQQVTEPVIEAFVERCINYFINEAFVDFIGDFAIHRFIDKNINERQIWMTNIQKMIFRVKTLNGQWVDDPEGALFRYFFIAPIIDDVVNKTSKYILKKAISNPGENTTKMINDGNRMLKYLENRNVEKEIIVYVAGHFRYKKQKNPLLEIAQFYYDWENGKLSVAEMEKLDKLEKLGLVTKI